MSIFVRRIAGQAMLAWLGSVAIVGASAQTPPPAVPGGTGGTGGTTVAPLAEKATDTAAPLAEGDQSPPTTVAAKPVSNPVVQAIVRLIEEHRTQGALAREAEMLSALAEFYSHRDQSLWTDAGGLRPNAATIAAEIRRADDWGLDSRAFDLPEPLAANAEVEMVAKAELSMSLAVIRYAWFARGGRLDPTALSLWLDARARPLDVAEVLIRISSGDDPAAALRALHPRHPHFEALRQAYLQLRAPGADQVKPDEAPKPVERIPSGPVLSPGMRHPDIAIVRRRLEIAAIPGDEALYDAGLAAAVKDFLRKGGLKGSAVIGAKARAVFNNADNKPARASKLLDKAAEAKKILANMERWRWLPEDLGRIHIWNNLPEFETRVVKDGEVVHQERIIIGKPATQTPVFSDAMRVVVFQPDWGVPGSIKIKELLPRLKDGDEDALHDKGMRIVMNGKTVDPGKLDWEKVDIRTIPIVQDPGPSNPLGQIKFLFPNKHDVYMHDTPTKHLFNQSVRTYSHGCIRVRNPRRLAEIVFAEDQGWEAAEIQSRLQPKAPANTRVPLNKRIPVHNVYFTVVPGPDGTLRNLADIYGHDQRIASALDGIPASQIAASDPARLLARELKEIAGDPSDSSAIARAAASRPNATASNARAVNSAGRSALGGPVAAKPAASTTSFVSSSRVSVFQRRTEDGL